MTMNMNISIVIITYKEDLAVLRECFASVAALIGVDAEVFVVDNGGRDETRSLLAEVLPNATYMPNPNNRGFAAAVNQGMRKATGEYVLLLNPDTMLPPTTLENMVAHMDADTDVGIGSCIIRYPDGTLQESIRRFPTFVDQLIILFKLPHVFPRLVDTYMMRDVDQTATQNVDSIMGAFMMIRRSVIDRIGYFDERYFIWFEEVDYCKMARKVGFGIRSYGDCTVVHHKGHMFNQLATIRKQKWIRQSMRKYFRKHHGIPSWLVLVLLAPLFIALAYLAALVKRK